MRKFIDIHGKQLAYLDEGQGFPILFGHSFLWHAHMWRPQIDFLKNHFRCIVPELWGHGESDNLNVNEYSIDQLTEDYHTLMHQLELEEFAVVGLSVGAMWATQMAIKHPNHVKALVIMDSFVGPEPEKTKLKYSDMTNQSLNDGCYTPTMIDSLLPFFFSPENIQGNSQIVLDFKKYLSNIPTENIATISVLSHTIFNRKSLLDQLPTLSIPTQVIVGELDLPRPVAEAQVMADLLNTPVNIIKNAAHISTLEQPDDVTHALHTFLQSCDMGTYA